MLLGKCNNSLKLLSSSDSTQLKSFFPILIYIFFLFNRLTPERNKVRYNTLTKGSGGQVVDVVKVIIHEQYDSTTTDNDIALLQTATPLILGSTNAKTAGLPTPGSEPTTGFVSVSGWGTLSDGTSPMELQIGKNY